MGQAWWGGERGGGEGTVKPTTTFPRVTHGGEIEEEEGGGAVEIKGEEVGVGAVGRGAVGEGGEDGVKLPTIKEIHSLSLGRREYSLYFFPRDRIMSFCP
jgi:hypothetical protein